MMKPVRGRHCQIESTQRSADPAGTPPFSQADAPMDEAPQANAPLDQSAMPISDASLCALSSQSELKTDNITCLCEESIPALPMKFSQERSFLHFKKWWFRREVDLSVNGEKITGTPIFIEDDIIRVVNDEYSYFIPLEKIDFFRTNDGLNM